MERVLIRLERNAEGIAEDMGRPNYSDKHKPNVHSGAWAAVGIDNKTGRIVAQTIIAIDSIDDPWEDVCRQILKRHVTVYYTMDFFERALGCGSVRSNPGSTRGKSGSIPPDDELHPCAANVCGRRSRHGVRV
jgi:hypothetical protein